MSDRVNRRTSKNRKRQPREQEDRFGWNRTQFPSSDSGAELPPKKPPPPPLPPPQSHQERKKSSTSDSRGLVLTRSRTADEKSKVVVIVAPTATEQLLAISLGKVGDGDVRLIFNGSSIVEFVRFEIFEPDKYPVKLPYTLSGLVLSLTLDAPHIFLSFPASTYTQACVVTLVGNRGSTRLRFAADEKIRIYRESTDDGQRIRDRLVALGRWKLRSE